jgi:hypothetical protein
MFRQVVARAKGQCLDGEHFIAEARHHDNRKRSFARVQIPEDGNAIHVREMKIEQHDVVAATLRDAGQTLLAGFHDVERNLRGRERQVRSRQIRIDSTVFGVEHPQRGTHDVHPATSRSNGG